MVTDTAAKPDCSGDAALQDTVQEVSRKVTLGHSIPFCCPLAPKAGRLQQLSGHSSSRNAGEDAEAGRPHFSAQLFLLRLVKTDAEPHVVPGELWTQEGHSEYSSLREHSM